MGLRCLACLPMLLLLLLTPAASEASGGHYDCHAGLSNWKTGWSEEKKGWCCLHGGHGCADDAKFDCAAGLDNWAVGWSDDKKGWCCRHASKGCPTTTPGYDCAAGLNNWEVGWSDDKKNWCCQHASKGCPTTTPEYDCNAGFSDWAQGWSVPKKAWCCDHAGKACEALRGCDTQCVIDGKAHSCKDRIHWSATHRFGGASRCAAAHQFVLKECPSCGTCLVEHTGCTAPAPTTTVTPASTTTAATTTMTATRPEPKGCNTTCVYQGKSATCRERIAWSAVHEYAGRPRACTSAYSQVLSQCPDCLVCHPSLTGCKSPVPEYDCDAGAWNWRKGWSKGKREYCCKHGKLGCPTAAKTAALHDCSAGISCRFDCDAGFTNCLKCSTDGWTAVKKAWCCKHEGSGCSRHSYVLVGFGNAREAREMCSAHPNKGLPMPKTDSEQRALQAAVEAASAAGSLSRTWPNQTIWLGGHYSSDGSEWQWDDGSRIGIHSGARAKLAAIGASSAHKQSKEPWLCMVEDGMWHDSLPHHRFGIMCQRDAGEPAAPEFDCEAEFDKWEQRWPAEKKAWCCEHKKRGCPVGRYTFVGFGTAREARSKCHAHPFRGLPMPRTEGETRVLQKAFDAAMKAGNLSDAWPNQTIWLGGQYSSADSEWQWDDGSKIGVYSGARAKLDAIGASSAHKQSSEPWLCMVKSGQWHDSHAHHPFGIMCALDGAAPEYDCVAGLQEEWSTDKKAWCCRNANEGCKGSVVLKKFSEQPQPELAQHTAVGTIQAFAALFAAAAAGLGVSLALVRHGNRRSEADAGSGANRGGAWGSLESGIGGSRYASLVPQCEREGNVE